jgi:hypothetical protein
MSWLAEVLDEARNVGERVWLLMHIPVGINDYNTVKNEEAGSLPVEFWQPVYTFSRSHLAAQEDHPSGLRRTYAHG